MVGMLTDFDKNSAPILAINLVVILLVFAAKSVLPPLVPLFYGLPTGEEQLASSTFLITPALTSIAVVLVNAFLARVVKNNFLQRVLLGISWATAALSTITIIRIIWLVGAF